MWKAINTTTVQRTTMEYKNKGGVLNGKGRGKGNKDYDQNQKAEQ